MATVLGRDLQAGQTVTIYLENEDGEFEFQTFKLTELHRQNERYSFWYFEGSNAALAVRNDLAYLAE